MLGPYGDEANFLIEEGALPHLVDEALKSFGMAMGPFEMGLVWLQKLWGKLLTFYFC